jgi:uncharacterized YccA/Bax inhibitor family protein
MIAMFVWTVSGIIDATIIAGIIFGLILIGIAKLLEKIISWWEDKE